MSKLQSKILLWMFLIIVPLLSVLFAYNVYTLRILNNQVASNNLDILSIYEKPVAKDIEYISYSMANLLANDADMLQLNYATSYLEAYLCCDAIAADYRAMVNSQLAGLGALGINSPYNGIFRMVYAESGNYTYFEKKELEETISSQILDDAQCNKKGWQLIQLEGRNYLLRILKNNHNYAVIVLDFSLITTPQHEKDETLDGYLVYAREDNVPLTMNAFMEEHQIPLERTNKNYYIAYANGEKYMLVEKDFPYAGIMQYYISPYKGAFQYLDYVQILLLVLTLIIALAIPFGFFYMRRKLFDPLETLIATMKSIGEGQTDARMEEEYHIEEFLQMKNSFNVMVDKINELKINAYEREIQLKNVQMQYLQIQIRPHFFLNCLKNIYALAEQKDFEKIQEMIIILSKYLRSMFKSNPAFITLGEEIEGVKNYVALQQMCQSEPPECRIDIDEGLLEFLIPPLSIITFIENSVKHGAQSDKKLMLSIRATTLTGEKNSYVCITILDNGPGFGEELPNLFGEDYEADGKEHIGIKNIEKRFEMFYGKEGTILCSNSNGACVELYIPIEREAGK